MEKTYEILQCTQTLCRVESRPSHSEQHIQEKAYRLSPNEENDSLSPILYISNTRTFIKSTNVISVEVKILFLAFDM